MQYLTSQLISFSLITPLFSLLFFTAISFSSSPSSFFYCVYYFVTIYSTSSQFEQQHFLHSILPSFQMCRSEKEGSDMDDVFRLVLVMSLVQRSS